MTFSTATGVTEIEIGTGRTETGGSRRKSGRDPGLEVRNTRRARRTRKTRTRRLARTRREGAVRRSRRNPKTNKVVRTQNLIS